MQQLVPAILAETSEDMLTKVRIAESFAEYAQIDFMDGIFVPTKSAPIFALVEAAPRFRMEAHLMVERPDSWFKQLREIGVERAYFHIESVKDSVRTIEEARQIGLEIGVAINPKTPLRTLKPVAAKSDGVLFLTVHPGHYGHEFIPDVLGKLSTFRLEHPGVRVGVDGGVKLENLEMVINARPAFITVGSAIFNAPDPELAYREFLKRLGARAA